MSDSPRIARQLLQITRRCHLRPLSLATASRAGFTLLEVLIALAVLAISSLAIIGQAGQSLTQTRQLQLQATALIVAENQLAAVQIRPEWPSLGVSTNRETLAGAQWQVQTDVSSTTDPWLRKVEVTVVFEDQSGGPRASGELIRLVGYRGMH